MKPEVKTLLEDILSDFEGFWDADDPNSSTAKMVVRIKQTLPEMLTDKQIRVMQILLEEEVKYLDMWMGVLKNDVEKYSLTIAQMNERKEFIQMTLKEIAANP